MPFKLFSRRFEAEKVASPFTFDEAPPVLRGQVWHILERAVGTYTGDHDRFGYAKQTISAGFWRTIRQILLEELGQFQLSIRPTNNCMEDCFQFFVNECTHSRALDFIDLSFRVVVMVVGRRNQYERASNGIVVSVEETISDLNARFDQHNLGYQFVDGGLIRRDSQYSHSEMTVPALNLLSEPGFEGPHEEFLRAHKAYLKPDERETIRECSNAFESTLKAICTKRSWVFDPHSDTAAKLLGVVFKQKLLPDYLQTEFAGLRATLEAGVPTIRNKSAGHGQGPVPVPVPRYLAAYVLHMTASAILLLAAADKELK